MQKIIVVSGPVIVENNKVLLDKQGDDPFWKFCGGRVRDNENLAETAIRRAKEELNIEADIINSEPFLLTVKKMTDTGEADIILVHFLAQRKNEPTPGPEVKEFSWLEINNLPDNIGPNIIPALKHFGYLK